MHGTVIGLETQTINEAIYLRSSPNYWTVSMCSIVAHWTIGIESRIEGKACTNASALHLSTPGDMRSHIMPCKQGLSDVWFRFYPSLVDGMSKAIGIDGSA